VPSNVSSESPVANIVVYLPSLARILMNQDVSLIRPSYAPLSFRIDGRPSHGGGTLLLLELGFA